MATIQSRTTETLKIKQFDGVYLGDNVGIKPALASDMMNFRVNELKQLEPRNGYSELCTLTQTEMLDTSFDDSNSDGLANGFVLDLGSNSGNTYTWTIRTTPNSNNWQGIAYGNGVYVAISDTGTTNRVMTSTDGETWTARTTPNSNNWSAICFGNGLFVAVAYSGTGNRVMTSPDGETWTARTSAADNTWTAIAYGNGLYVAVADSGVGNRVMTSPDAVTWTIRSTPADNNWRSICYGNGLYVVVAITGTGNRVMTSPDAVTWTIRTSAANNDWRAVRFGNGLYVAVASTGTGNRVMTSPDATTWTLRTSAADNNWAGLDYGDGLFVAVAYSGAGNRVMTSPDATTWTLRTSAADNNWYNVCYGNGKFVSTSSSGTTNRVMTMPYINSLFTGSVSKSVADNQVITLNPVYSYGTEEVRLGGIYSAFGVYNNTMIQAQITTTTPQTILQFRIQKVGSPSALTLKIIDAANNEDVNVSIAAASISTLSRIYQQSISLPTSDSYRVRFSCTGDTSNYYRFFLLSDTPHPTVAGVSYNYAQSSSNAFSSLTTLSAWLDINMFSTTTNQKVSIYSPDRFLRWKWVATSDKIYKVKIPFYKATTYSPDAVVELMDSSYTVIDSTDVTLTINENPIHEVILDTPVTLGATYYINIRAKYAAPATETYAYSGGYDINQQINQLESVAFTYTGVGARMTRVTANIGSVVGGTARIRVDVFDTVSNTVVVSSSPVSFVLGTTGEQMFTLTAPYTLVNGRVYHIRYIDDLGTGAAYATIKCGLDSAGLKTTNNWSSNSSWSTVGHALYTELNYGDATNYIAVDYITKPSLLVADLGFYENNTTYQGYKFVPIEITGKDSVLTSNNNPVTLYQETSAITVGERVNALILKSHNGNAIQRLKAYNVSNVLIDTVTFTSTTQEYTIPVNTDKLRLEIAFNQLAAANINTLTVTAFSITTDSNIRSIFSGKIGTTNHLLLCSYNTIYEVVNNVATVKYTSPNDITAATFIKFGQKIYMVNGVEFLEFDGTTFTEVVGYVPTIMIGGVANVLNGGGTNFEDINLLTYKRKAKYSAVAGGNNVFYLPEINLASIDSVVVGGVTLTPTTHYTPNTGAGKITMVGTYDPPPAGTNHIVITYTVSLITPNVTGNERLIIENMTSAIVYGGKTDTRLHLYGNPNYPNRIIWSSLGDGIPRADYFSAYAFNDIGDGSKIMTVSKHYDRLKIFMESQSYYSYYDVVDNIPAFPVYPLNDSIGSMSNESVVMENSIVTFDAGVYTWTNETINSQTNAKRISERVDTELLECEHMINVKYLNELWLSNGSVIYVYNYKWNVWYKYNGLPLDCWFYDDSTEILYAADGGVLCQIDRSILTDKGNLINAYWESSWLDMGDSSTNKTIRSMFVTVMQDAAGFTVELYTENEGLVSSDAISYAALQFPKTQYIDVHAINETFFKVKVLTSGRCTISSLTIPYHFNSKLR